MFNENQWIHLLRSGNGRGADRCYGERIYEELLPAVCAQLDPTRPYWPGSPWGGTDPNSELEGNHHVWHVNINNPNRTERADYQKYALDRAKFVSEFGILSPPPLQSLKYFLPPEEISRTSRSWEFHNNTFEQGTLQLALQKYWQPVENLSLPDYLTYAQMIQAEALTFSLEHWRRRKFNTSGTLFWMYTDCWGGVGWTIIDYYLRKKPSYYAVKRAFHPTLVSIKQEPDSDSLSIWLSNDTLQEVAGTLEYGFVELETSQKQTTTRQVQVTANASEAIASLDISQEMNTVPGHWLAYCRLFVDGRLVSATRYFLAGFFFNTLALPQTRLAYDLEHNILTIRATAFAWQVAITLPTGVEVEDNYFDLLPGEERKVIVHGPQALFEQISISALNALD